MTSDIDLVSNSCPTIKLEFLYDDGNALNLTIFTYDEPNLDFKIENADLTTSTGPNSIDLIAKVDGFPTTAQTLNFNVDIVNACSIDPLDLSLVTEFDAVIEYSIYEAV